MNKHMITEAVKSVSMVILLFLVMGMMFGCSTQEKDRLSASDETSSMMKENQTTTLVSDAGNEDESESELEGETYVRAVTEDGMCYFEGTVTKKEGNSFLVKPSMKYWEAESYSKIRIYNMFPFELKIGDVVTFYYNGFILEISPPLLDKVYKMTMVNENGELIEAVHEENMATREHIDYTTNILGDDYVIETTKGYIGE